MQKIQAVASLGQTRLLLPSWIKSALSANDRLKVYLTVLQAASSQAANPNLDVPDFAIEMAAAKLDSTWLRDLAAVTSRIDDDLLIPDLAKLVKCFEDDLATMARPILESTPAGAEPHMRVKHWMDWLHDLRNDRLSDQQLEALTHGRRGGIDSLHLLVMDLHKQINKLSGDLASEVVDGAKVWELEASDRSRVIAFMRGLNRTAGLKFDHPGLDTVATRDGDRLLLQNDIGTNDAHVLVLEVTDRAVTLTYSDLHRVRLEFFQALLEPFGAKWTRLESRTDSNLNQGAAYSVSTAHFDCANDAEVEKTLEGIGSRIVFLIDWNRARKRLQAFVDKDDAIAILAEVARLDVGHRAWLQLGGERLIFAAMQAAGEGAFRIGDRMDDVLGLADAHAFLVAVMRLACNALRRGLPAALVGDETRMLLARHVGQRSGEFDLLAEHASYCQTLAQAVSDGLAHGAERSSKSAGELAVRAKAWERKADHLVMQARENAERQPRWRPVARLVEQSDDVVDAMEEAAFLISLIADRRVKGWNDNVRKQLAQLAATVLDATQNQVKAIAIARMIGPGSESVDNDAFLGATWRIVQAERQCDGLLREARRVILGTIDDTPSLILADDLAGTLELASDRLLTSAYSLRDLAFDHAGVR